jgi:CubicO group peptidase (beta-lactamase class C family)
MQTGIPWNEQVTGYGRWDNDALLFFGDAYSGKTHLAYLAEKSQKGLEDRLFNYNGGLTYLVGRIVEHLSGKPIEVFADEVLLKPLGIVKNWELYDELRVMSSGISMTGAELSRMGELILKKGCIDGKQLVASEWIERMFDVHVSRDELGDPHKTFYGFGYHAWRDDVETDKGRLEIFAGIGTGGQRLYLIPSEQLIVTMQSSFFAESLMKYQLTSDEKESLDLQGSYMLQNIILPHLGHVCPSLLGTRFEVNLENARNKLCKF